jgi:hypothetical protein
MCFFCILGINILVKPDDAKDKDKLKEALDKLDPELQKIILRDNPDLKEIIA